jgi:hypothetical protein
VALVAAAALGCTHRHVQEHSHAKAPAPVYAKKKGPPPWAPAHGYRRKHGEHHHHHGVEVRFDTGLGVYVVVGHPGRYFDGAHYFRLADGGWQLSVQLDRGWKPARSRQVPPGLLKVEHRKKHRKKHRHGVPASRGR